MTVKYFKPLSMEKLATKTEERIQRLTYSDFMDAMESLKDDHLFRNELLSAIHKITNKEEIGSALMVALFRYHEADIKLHGE